MRKRPIENYEQPEVLASELGAATVIDDDGNPVETAPRGVPHGVTRAIVTMENVRVERGNVFFCDSHHYRVRQSSLYGADDGAQPPVHASEVSASQVWLPRDGFYRVRARVALNGSRKVHIEKFEPAMV